MVGDLSGLPAVGVGIGIECFYEPSGSAVLGGGGGDEVVDAALVFEDHEGDDVAGDAWVADGGDGLLESIELDGGCGHFALGRLQKRAVAQVGE